MGADRDRLEAEVKQLKADILDMELSLKHRMVYCPTCNQGAVGLYKGECFPCAAARAYRNGHYTGQNAMRKRCAEVVGAEEDPTDPNQRGMGADFLDGWSGAAHHLHKIIRHMEIES